MIKLIIFDWDDVLVLGAKEAYFDCYHITLVKLGVILAPQEERKRILAKWSKPHREELRELLREKPQLLDQACSEYEKIKDKYFLTSLKLVPGVNNLLRILSKKYKLTVATGNTREMIKNQIMPFFHIPDVFLQLTTSHDLKDQRKAKPHPYMLQIIMQKQKVKPNEVLYVGDANVDVLMAQAAHVNPVVVLTGHLSKSEALDLGVKYIIDDVTHLHEIIKEIEYS